MRLSSLEGIDQDLYSGVVLPKILETIVSCKDTMSQQYLMECVIQAFPDEFHLITLEPLLEATTKLTVEVEIKTIFISLMEGLGKFASDQDILSINKNINIFKLFKKYTDKIIETQGGSIELSKLLELVVAFLKFSIKTYGGNVDYVNDILESSAYLIKSNRAEKLTKEAMGLLVKVLTIPLESLSLQVLGMSHYPALMEYMEYKAGKQVGLKIVQAVLGTKKPLDTEEVIEQLVGFIKPLLEEDKKQDEDIEAYEFQEEQESLSKLLNLTINEDLTIYYTLLQKWKKLFVKGGELGMKYSIPTLVF